MERGIKKPTIATDRFFFGNPLKPFCSKSLLLVSGPSHIYLITSYFTEKFKATLKYPSLDVSVSLLILPHTSLLLLHPLILLLFPSSLLTGCY